MSFPFNLITKVGLPSNNSKPLRGVPVRASQFRQIVNELNNDSNPTSSEMVQLVSPKSTIPSFGSSLVTTIESHGGPAYFGRPIGQKIRRLNVNDEDDDMPLLRDSDDDSDDEEEKSSFIRRSNPVIDVPCADPSVSTIAQLMEMDASSRHRLLQKNPLLRTVLESQGFIFDEHGNIPLPKSGVTTTSTPVSEQDCDLEYPVQKYLETLSAASEKAYRLRLLDYKTYCMAKKLDFLHSSSAVTYLKYLRADHNYQASTLWSIQAMLGTYFKV